MAFEKFKKIHGAPQKCEKVSGEQIKNYQGKLTDDLLEEWNKSGWCSFGDGFLWTVDPEDYSDVMDDWLEKAGESFAFARTAFGSIFFRNGSDNFLLDVLNNDVSRVFARIDYVFDGTLCDGDYLDDVLLRPLFKDALDKLGVLSKDECYGVFPPPAMGGEIALDNLEKVKIKEYLAILSQT